MEPSLSVKRILEQCKTLDAMRLPNEGVWDELGGICFPRNGSMATQRQPSTGGRPDRQRVAENYDGTAMRACNTLATGQSARITPMGARWFVLRPPASLTGNQVAENWYARCTEILIAKLGSSNFYNRAYECYQYRGCYGISALETTAGAADRGLHFRVMPVGTFSIAENSLDEVDTIYRRYYRTPAQLAEQFGEKALPKDVGKKFADAATRHLNSEEIIHAIEPRRDRDPRRMDAANKPTGSWHVHVASATLLRESGFDSMPVACSRWQTNALNPYGWAPADYALPEALQANFQEQMLDVLSELAAFPRILYPAGMKDEIDFGALGLTSFDPSAGETAVPREWMTAGRYDISKDRAADKKRSIEAAFFTELFTAVSRLSPTATATQVGAIVSESREMFHPIYSNMVREFHTPVLRRCFTLLLQQGEMPPPPPGVIQSDDIGPFIADPEVEYVSAMALALEQSNIAGFSEILQVLTPLAQLDPQWLAFLNPEAIGPYLVIAKGLPTSFLRTPEQMQAMAQAQAQAQQAQQAMLATQAVRNIGGVDEAAKAAQMVSQAQQQ